MTFHFVFLSFLSFPMKRGNCLVLMEGVFMTTHGCVEKDERDVRDEKERSPHDRLPLKKIIRAGRPLVLSSGSGMTISSWSFKASRI